MGRIADPRGRRLAHRPGGHALHRASTLRAVAAAVQEPMAIAAPLQGGRRGHPVAFGRGHGAALASLTGDAGARALLQAHPGSLLLLPCDDPGVLQDIDLPEHLPTPAI